MNLRVPDYVKRGGFLLVPLVDRAQKLCCRMRTSNPRPMRIRLEKKQEAPDPIQTMKKMKWRENSRKTSN